MKRLLILGLLLLVALTGFAAEKDEKRVRSDSEVTEQSKQPRASQKDAKKKAQPNWPRPYSPTEEVRADSIVPFPTDI